MELRHLRYLVTLAEELSFTRAANRLGISQPSLTVQIKSLERRLGVQLFVRSSTGVSLTPATAAIVEQARLTLAAADHIPAVVKAHATAVRPLRLGFFRAPWTGWELADHLTAATGSRIEPIRLQPADGLRQLAVGQLDTLLGYDFSSKPSVLPVSIHRVDLVAEPVWLALSSSHPVAERHTVNQQIELPALRDQTWLTLDDNPELAEIVATVCRHHGGFEPAIRPVSTDDLLRALVSGLGITLATPLIRRGHGLTTRRLSVPESRNLYLAWRDAEQTPNPQLATPDRPSSLAEAFMSFYLSHAQHNPLYAEWLRSQLSRKSPP